MALPPCPHCKREFEHSNAGARENHVKSCAQKAAKYQQNNQAGGQTPNQPREEPGKGYPNIPLDPNGTPDGTDTAPAVVQDGQPQGGAGLPDVPATEALEQGIALGEAASAFRSDDPDQRRVASGQLLQVLAGAAGQYGQNMIEDARAGRERAKQASSDQIRVAEDYPTCPECSVQITNLPEPGVEFGCPGCGVVLVA